MYGEERIRQLAETILAASEADQTEVVFTGTSASLTRFANNTIHQHVAETGGEVTVRAVLGKRTGVASGNRLDAEGVREIAARAVAIARLQPEDPRFVSLPAPMAWERAHSYSEATAQATPVRRAEGVATIVKRAQERGFQAFGHFSTETTELAVFSSLGTATYHTGTVAEINTVVMSDSGSGYASAVAADVDVLDAEAVATRAVDLCARNARQAMLPPGEYEVLLEPAAVAELLDFMAGDGFNGLAFEEQRSFMSGRLGQRLLSPNVSIWDDGHDRRGLPLPFDFEGVPKRRTVFIDRGVAKEVAHDSATAARAGTISTGHALPPPNTFGPVPANLFMANGDARSREEMVRGIERGVWVTRFWYVNLLHPLSLTLTGMTRDGTFLIEHGEVKGAVHNLRFTQSVVEAFGDVRALSADLALQRSWLGATLVPAVHLGRFTFTGATKE